MNNGNLSFFGFLAGNSHENNVGSTSSPSESVAANEPESTVPIASKPLKPVYRLSKLLAEVAIYYQGREEGAPEVACLKQHQLLEESLQYCFNQSSEFCDPYIKTYQDGDNARKTVIVQFDATIYWHLSKKDEALTIEEINTKLKQPTRAEIVGLNPQNYLGEGAYASVALNSFSLKLGENQQIQLVKVKTQSKKVTKKSKPRESGSSVLETEYDVSQQIYQGQVHVAKSKPQLSSCDALILPFVHGNDLSSLVEGGLIDKQATLIMAVIMINAICSLRHLHAKNLSHGDIKLENCKLELTNYFNLFIDFGFSSEKFDPEHIRCTPIHAAPEVVSRMYGFHMRKVTLSPALDIYSLGTFFISLYGINLYPESPEPSNFNNFFKNQRLNLPEYLNVYARDCVEQANEIPEEIKNIILPMISKSAYERPSLRDVIMQLLKVIDNEFENNKSFIATQNFAELHLIFQTMLWNLISTEVFVIAATIKALPELSEQEKEIISELEHISYVYEKFSDPAPDAPTKTCGQYVYEQIPLFARKHIDKIEHPRVKEFFNSLIEINTKADEEVYADLAKTNMSLINSFSDISESTQFSLRMGR